MKTSEFNSTTFLYGMFKRQKLNKAEIVNVPFIKMSFRFGQMDSESKQYCWNSYIQNTNRHWVKFKFLGR